MRIWVTFSRHSSHLSECRLSFSRRKAPELPWYCGIIETILIQRARGTTFEGC